MSVLPKAELHLHLEGTLEPELLLQIAKRNAIALPTADVDALRAEYRFTGLRSFLDLYYRNVAVLRTEQDFFDLASAYLERAWRGGVRRAEIFVDPQQHLRNAIPLDAVFGGLSAARADAESRYGISSDLLVCFLRDLGPEAATQTLRATLPFREHFIGVGLDSAEVGHPPRLFAESFAIASAEGLHTVAHAGEEGGPEYVWEALDVLGVERIDHGIRAMEDPDLVRRLRDEQIPLTVCPLSNVALRAVGSLQEHCLPRMLAEDLMVTINSDDPAYFGGYVDDNFAAAQSVFGLGEAQMCALARNSFEACFAGEQQRAQWLCELL